MTDSASRMTELFQSGRIRHQVWDAQAVKYARLCLPSILDMDTLTLTENQYLPVASTTFAALMRCLAQQKALRELHIAQEDLSPLLPGLAAAPWPQLQYLDTLQLTVLPPSSPQHDHLIVQQHAVYFRGLVKLPKQKLVVSFQNPQQDYAVILASIQKGIEDLEKANLKPPQVMFRKVNIPNHEIVLQQFATLVQQTNVLTHLQLHRYRRDHGVSLGRLTDCRVHAPFFQAIITLLQTTRLQELEISHIEASPELRNNASHAIWPALRSALENNTTLQRLAMASTRGLQTLWQAAIFPALTVNNTLQSLDFAHVHTTAVTRSFLQHLPYMRGLQHVHAPGRQTFGAAWLEYLQRDDTPVTHLTVEFSLGAFSHAYKKDTAFGRLEYLLQRNRCLVQAQAYITRNSEETTSDENEEQLGGCSSYNNNEDDEIMMDALANFGQQHQGAGLSAIYHVVRNSLFLFTTAR